MLVTRDSGPPLNSLRFRNNIYICTCTCICTSWFVSNKKKRADKQKQGMKDVGECLSNKCPGIVEYREGGKKKKKERKKSLLKQERKISPRSIARQTRSSIRKITFAKTTGSFLYRFAFRLLFTLSVTPLLFISWPLGFVPDGHRFPPPSAVRIQLFITRIEP